jgi:hypothetical protein
VSRPGAHRLSPEQVAEYRDALGLIDGVPDVAAMEALDDFLDLRAGPLFCLSDDERAVRRACRERFGSYDPSAAIQSRFVSEWRASQQEAA